MSTTSTESPNTHTTRTRVKIVREIEQPAVPPSRASHAFHKMSQGITAKAGSPITFLLAIVIVIIWAVSGPFFNYSNTWQLAINTGTTIVTFLMVFAIQNSQNRDSHAMQLKLDELIRSGKARNQFVDVEELEDGELEQLHGEFKDLHERFVARRSARAIGSDALKATTKSE